MKAKKIFILSVILITVSNFIYAQNLADFKSLLQNCGMNFEKPSDLAEAELTYNADMLYEYALKNADEEFEVRYSIRPITKKAYENDAAKEELEKSKDFRNSGYEKVLKAILFNISGTQARFGPFDENAVKSEFNADWGATTMVPLDPKREFGKGYKYCMVVALHKKDVADAYYFYLANSQEKFRTNVQPIFHALRFD